MTFPNPSRPRAVRGRLRTPRRILLESLPPDDPRRLAAQVEAAADVAVEERSMGTERFAAPQWGPKQ